MTKRAASKLDEKALLALTADGERALKQPGTTLSRAELKALVLVDGMATLERVLKRVKSDARPALRETLMDLIARNLVGTASELPGGMIDAGDFFTRPKGRQPAPGSETRKEADIETAFLRHNGYCVNMARRGAAVKRADGHKLTVLIVDDDPDIGGLLRKYLHLENMETRMASDTAGVIAAFRQPPVPDLVLLDIGLPGIDGFDILMKMREHPVLKSVPVIMLTGTATREVVLKGLVGGADGHITKPFKIRALVRGVKSVLGIDFDPNEHD